ncbi:MAG: nhaS3 1 [Myxococcaceae bacterium]|nr:nhaS3 1 [Myxococcaceae bacterium]
MRKPVLQTDRLKTGAAYSAMIVLSVLGFLGVRSLGDGLRAPAPTSALRFGSGHGPAQAETLLHVLLALLLIVAVARLLGALFRKLEQPAVVGEVIAGIALGPSLLGRVAPELAAYVLPPSVAPSLSIIAQIGVILFMFLVGVELDTGHLRNKAHTALAISHASIIAPFLLGAGTSLWLYPKLSTSDVPFPLFALFMGVAMSITAFPVLARILTDRGMHKSKLGVIALSCAAVDDVTAWCLLAFVVSLASSKAGSAVLTVGLTFGYIALVWFAARPLVQRYVRQQELRQQLGKNAVALVIIGLIGSALVTEYIGIHAIFGAFLLGTIIPHESLLARSLKQKLEDLVVVLLLPAFFAFTGLRTQIGLVSSGEQWLMCGAIVAVACVGKFGGTFVAARLTGLDRRDAASLGALMNTRGLMELVVLNIGLDLGVISPTLFAMMVFMAVVTTLATSPLLSLFARGASQPTKASSASVS